MKPILFNTEMVRAILDGRKTVTRRVIKRKQVNDEPCGYGFWVERNERDGITYVKDYNHSPCWYAMKEYLERFGIYQIGDILYVRETWGKQIRHGGSFLAYKADDENMNNFDVDKNGSYPTSKVKWHPSIHMPKEAARIFLKVTDVRVERLQDITEEQAIKEGCSACCESWGDSKFEDVIEFEQSARDMFSELWNGTLKKDSDCTWMHNPWVWVIEFERVSREGTE